MFMVQWLVLLSINYRLTINNLSKVERFKEVYFSPTEITLCLSVTNLTGLKWLLYHWYSNTNINLSIEITDLVVTQASICCVQIVYFMDKRTSLFQFLNYKSKHFQNKYLAANLYFMIIFIFSTYKAWALQHNTF